MINSWDPLNSDSPTYFDIGDGQGERGLSTEGLLNSHGQDSLAVITIMSDAPNEYDAPYANGSGSLLGGGGMFTAGHDYEISLTLPALSSGSYDLYLYSTVSSPSTFTLYSGYDNNGTQYGSPQTPSSSGSPNINQYVQFTGLSGGFWTIKVSGGYNICNGLQIHRVP